MSLKNPFSPSVTLKVNLIIIGILSVFLLLANLVLSRIIARVLEDDALRRCEVVTRLFAEINRLPLERMDYFTLENNTRELLKSEDIVQAKVFDVNGVELTLSGRETPPPAEDLRLVERQALSPEGRKLGNVQVVFSLERIHSGIARAHLFLSVIMLFVIFGTVASLAGLIRLVVTRPIRSLLASVREVTRGNLDREVKVSSRDEIGELSTDFNTMTERLRESLALTRNILESMPSVMVSVDQDSRVTQWNPAAEAFTGVGARDALGKPLGEVSPLLEKYVPAVREVIGKRSPHELRREVFGNAEAPTFLDVSVFPLSAGAIRGAVLRMDDVTTAEKREQQLIQAQKMELVGTLAGGLAHDFNNVLSGIVGTVSILQYKLRKHAVSPQELDQDLKVIKEAGGSAMDMVQQLLALSHKQELTPEEVDLRTAVENVIRICRNTFDKCIDVSTNLPREAAMVHADGTQMEQVILNLCVNASHAMTIMRKEGDTQGGSILLSIDRVLPDRFFCSAHPEAKEIDYWVLSISDTGVGMDARTVGKIFDPFFTTKEKGTGTGLGLAMVYNIVSRHGGFITVYSEVGLGSTFYVYLPMLHGAAVRERPESEDWIPSGTGTVLVVDDEPHIRDIARMILEECGYTVMLAENGRDGLQKYKDSAAEIKAVILDLQMPVMSGEETFRRLREFAPDVKVLLSSGYAQDERVTTVMRLGVNGFIHKPYTLQELASAIHRVVGGEN